MSYLSYIYKIAKNKKELLTRKRRVTGIAIRFAILKFAQRETTEWISKNLNNRI